MAFAAVNFGAVLRDGLQNHASAQRFDEAPKLDSYLGALGRTLAPLWKRQTEQPFKPDMDTPITTGRL
jgi:hypothetical protein